MVATSIRRPAGGLSSAEQSRAAERLWHAGLIRQREAVDHSLADTYWRWNGNSWNCRTPLPRSLSVEEAAKGLSYLMAGQVVLDMWGDLKTRQKSFAVDLSQPAPRELFDVLNASESPLRCFAQGARVSYHTLRYAEQVAVRLWLRAEALVSMQGVPYGEHFSTAQLTIDVLVDLVRCWGALCCVQKRPCEISALFAQLQLTKCAALSAWQETTVRHAVDDWVRKHPPYEAKRASVVAALLRRLGSPTLDEEHALGRRLYALAQLCSPQQISAMLLTMAAPDFCLQ